MKLQSGAVRIAMVVAWTGLASMAQPATRLAPEELIRQFDRNGDGKISRSEAPDRMLQRWEQIDTDDDGYVTLDELRARDARVARDRPQQAAPSDGPGRPAGTFQPSGDFSVLLVGTGGPPYDPQRSGPSALVQYKGRCFLLDMGNRTQARLEEAGIRVRQIEALLLTHHHLDHNEEFIPLYLHSRLAGGRPEVAGPPGTRRLVDFLLDFYAEDLRYRLARSGRTANELAPPAVREVRGGESFDLGGVKVTTAAVHHSIETVAYRFDAGGRSIVISGDLAYSEGLVKLARGADVLVIDSGGAIVRKGQRVEDAAGPGRPGPGSGRQPLLASSRAAVARAHSSREEVVAMVKECGARQVVLTHIAPGEIDEPATAAVFAGQCQARIIVARDGLEVVAGQAAEGPGAAGDGVIVRVRAAAQGDRRDGRSWATALATVQEGIDQAARAGGGEVWVAAGTYKPTRLDDRSQSIRLRTGVAVYGGFKGVETALDQRDVRRNETILSGDIGRPGHQADNSYHVVVGADAAVLDGFTVRDGYGLDAEQGGPGPMGGPIHTSPGAILRGASPSFGAGMLNFQCAPTVRNCRFIGNSAGKGGAMYNMVSRSFPPGRERPAPAPLIVDCTFEDNFARGRGGGIANDLGTSPTFRGCSFLRNVCQAKGGALYNDFGCSPVLANCLFVGNRAASAAAVGNDGGSSPLLVHCTFTANLAAEEGAALYQGTGPANNPVVAGCILWGNRCENGPAEIFNWHDNDPAVTDSCVQGGWAGKGNVDRDPRLDGAAGEYRPAGDGPCAAMGWTVPTPDEMLTRLASQRAAPEMESGRRQPPPHRGDSERTPVRIAYVKAGAKAGGKGSSWQDAFATLDQAIEAWPQGRVEVWVAAGTYTPGEAEGRAASFRLRPGLELYGGFRGVETSRTQRDWKTNLTALSGDLGKKGEPADNAYHVVVGADESVLDGFVIRDGNADGATYDGHGGGMVNYLRAPQAGPMGAATGFSPVVRHCTFAGNHAREGGAVYNYDRSRPQFLQCLFASNSADWGGAMVDRVGVRSVLTACRFENNQARWRAGAIYLDYGARPVLTDCQFASNRCQRNGGAVAMISRASQLENTIALLSLCAFSGNAAGNQGGALAACDSAVVGLDRCSFTDNRAQAGAAIAAESRCRAVLVDCRFSSNQAAAPGGEIHACPTSTISRDSRDWPDQGDAMPGPPRGGR